MTWINTLLLLAVVAGHTELIVALVNRIHGLPLPSGLLRKIRHLHDVVVPTFPLVVLWFVGLNGPGLFIGGSWQDLSLAWSIYFGICGLGALELIGSIILRHLQTPTTAELDSQSEIVDIAKRLGQPPIEDGPYRSLVGFPGNQIFQVEVSEKTFRLPRLPAEWDDLRILQVTDMHFIGTIGRPFFEEVCELSSHMNPDLVVFTGDLIDRQELVDWLPTTLGRLSAPLGCYYILGNHDWNLDPQPIRSMMDQLGWHDVAGRCEEVDIKGRTMVIGGTEKPWMGQHPDFSKVNADAFRLLLSHTPDNIKWAREQEVDLMLSGHNHGGQVRLPVIGPVYSPSVYGTKYASGVFWEEPTLLHVSRGISGQHPLRINCRPELTKLVFKAQTLNIEQTAEPILEAVSV